MLRAYKYRIYPDVAQALKIDQAIGACRLVYNLALETKMYAYQTQRINLSTKDLCYQLVPLKKDYPWIEAVDSQALQASVKRLDKAFDGFFNGGGYPKYKSKVNSRQSFQCPNNKREVDWEKSLLSIPKIYDIPIKLSRKFEGLIKTVTISKTPTGKYFVSILVEDDIKPPIIPEKNIAKAIGLDTGIKSFVVTSDGKEYAANRKLKDALKRLKVLQRRASRKKKGSNNRKKANKKVATLYEKITNKRLDYIHKVTHDLTSDNQAVSTIVVEDLNVSGLLKNHKLAQAVSDVSFGTFYEILTYKCKWNGINLVKINRYDPSSKRCSCCGHLKEELKLSERIYHCDVCSYTENRDINAAKNVLYYGFNQRENVQNKKKGKRLNKKTSVGSRGEPVELSALAEAKKQENKIV